MTRDMRTLDYAQLRRIVGAEPRTLVFATVSGAHLYGFPSSDSDVDLRGTHVAPLVDVVGLRSAPETTTRDWLDDGAEIDLVTHDVAKYFRMLLQRNGYVLEQLLSPLIVTTSDVHEELSALAPRLITAHHSHHYLGFARTQWALFAKNGELKPLLYTLRVLLTGIHLMESGEVQAHLPTLLEEVGGPSYVRDLMAAKADGEHNSFDGKVEQVTQDVLALTARLEAAAALSTLPDRPTAYDQLHDILVRLRLANP